MSNAKRKTSVVAMMAVLASLLLPVLAAAPAGATTPINVSFDNQGCKLPATYSLTPQPHCADADYHSGNLGKGWNELDLVPFRLFGSTGNQNGTPATQTYNISEIVDYKDGSPLRPGYDVLSVLTKNTALSTGTSANCAIVNGNEAILTPGLGGIAQSLYRDLAITQEKNTTCVFDFYARLAVGSHLFPGSSLHTNLANENHSTAGIGAQDISIPVKEILPQSIKKTVGAVQDSDFAWTINKSPSPAVLHFGNVCDTANFDSTLQTDVTITWTKIAGAPQAIKIHTLIEATNPAARVITINVSDQLFSGVNPIGAPTVSGPVDVPANTTDFDVLEYDTTVPAATQSINDVATATYTDKLTGVPVPGQTTATATATVGQGNVTNGTATITDVETISGAGASFTVDSVTGDADATNGDTLSGTNPVTWTSGTVSGGGSVVLHKTVTLDPTVGSTSADLDDTATINGSDGFTTTTTGHVDIDSTLVGQLTIVKQTTVPVDGDTTFHFNVTPGNLPVSVTILKGQTQGTSAPLTGLTAGNYTATEVAPFNGFTPADPKPFSIGVGKCSAELTFVNTFSSASLKVLKVTVPDTASKAGFTFTVTKDGAPFATGTSDATGTVIWDPNPPGSDTLTISAEGHYVVTETTAPGFEPGVGTGDCDFTVDFPGDASKPFVCTFTNTALGSITIAKVTSPPGSSQSFTFTRDFGSPTVNLTDGQSNKVSDLKAGNYSAAETPVPDGWDLAGFVCDNGDDASSITLNPGEDIICTATNVRQVGNIVIQKVTVPSPDTTNTDFPFTTNFMGNFTLKDGGFKDSGPLPTGIYSAAEVAPAGWDLDSFTCSDGSPVTAIDLGKNETVTCTATNIQRGSIIVKKITDPANSTQKFTFTGDAAGTIDNTQQIKVDNLKPGDYTSTEAAQAGWDLTKIECDDANSTATGSTANFKLDPGETVTCTFTNKEQTGTITVVKVTDPSPDPSGTAFPFVSNFMGNFTLKNTESKTSGALSVNGGPYSVAETPVPAGWDKLSFTCTGGDDPSAITLSANENVICTATNRARGAIEITKTFNGAVPPAGSSYTFQLRTGASQGVEGITQATLILNSGNNFVGTFSNLVPGAYQVCETGIPVGGHSDLSDLPGAFTPTPDPGDNSTQCAPVTVTAGSTLKMTVNNTPPPGGDQRTIGYWKNWASCAGSNGKQAPKLDQTLFVAGVNGISVGDLVLYGGATADVSPDCAKAVNILNKTTIDGKKKMASDPAFNLAAQLLAAKLNVVAGAGQCPAATTAIAQAQALLDLVNFDGTKAPTMTAAQKTQANTLATTLDQYNNGSLC